MGRNARAPRWTIGWEKNVSESTDRYAVELNEGAHALYTTDDRGRAWSTVFGIFVGSGTDTAEASTRTNGMMNALVASREVQSRAMKDGRSVQVRILGADSEDGDQDG